MTARRVLTHPGPRNPARFTALPCRARPVELQLQAGIPVEQAVVQAFSQAGFSAGYLRLADASFTRLSYVIPGPAPGDGRAAWYSATHVIEDAVLAEAGLHLGRKNGAPFLHCHGLWSDVGGPLRMGHLLTGDSILARDLHVSGWGLSGATLEVQPDPETGFELFTPTATTSSRTGQPALLCRLRPNEDPHALLPQAGATLGKARIEGLGSLINTSFTDGTQDSYATEVLLRSGRLDRDGVTIEAASVGLDGEPMSGILHPHDNRICITAEVLLIAEP
ncbi:hypothetical protein [Paracoccus seriniphilus]|uniref:PPC domain-containing protein n=1 Tax=Paracoccus seriniphilus TaxID=184748 RepID=A0A239PN94_9RHOB|nr:hypothetical protein [Paracoccus seriniphilus]WCR14807.1 DUF296 domain-containing protein [Paracoccus seriniphilus]SNT71779.1 hypothetical protein SAMN05444959_102296 [Paracoccus seriniphilus]